MADSTKTPDASGPDRLSNIRPHIGYRDLRDWIAEADKLGEIREVSGLSWEREIGMASEVILHDEHAPCVIFKDVPGSLPGSRVLVNFFGGKRQRMTLGFPEHLDKMEMSKSFRTHYMSDLKVIPHKVVDNGPVLENRMVGDDVNINIFPTPMWHEKDGGRYIGTGSFNVTRDPEEGWINCGTYRVMIHDDKRVGFYISPGKHGRIHRDKYEKRGEPMPVAIVVGCDPMSFLMGSSEIP
ncbi:MAG: UbiD-like subunit of potential (de) carboxylase, partial [Pseudomonadota bacterium]